MLDVAKSSPSPVDQPAYKANLEELQQGGEGRLAAEHVLLCIVELVQRAALDVLRTSVPKAQCVA